MDLQNSSLTTNTSGESEHFLLSGDFHRQFVCGGSWVDMVNIPLYNCDLSSILFAADCTFVPNCIQNTIHSRKPRKLRVFSEETGLNLVASCKKLTKELGRKQYLHPRKRTNMTMGKKKQSFEDVSSIKNGVLFHSR